MKLPRVSLCLILSTSAFSQDFRPESHFETIPAADSSVQECYVFRTKAGLRYTVESSHDLTNWTPQEEIYGLGNEYVVTLRQYTPPPPPPPGAPSSPVPFIPVRNASIRMERAAGAPGWTVVSWASLDHGGPMVVRIAGEMAAEWFQIPLYSERFGDHSFFVWHPPGVVNPPVVNSILEAKDSAMLAVLEASLPTMNDQMIASVARIRNAPAPAPVSVDPNSKRFWRVFVNAEIDTDLDGTQDWSEFEIAAREAAAPPLFSSMNDVQIMNSSSGSGGGSTASGNAFNADTNGDGIPDGEQLDSDDDGIADAFDIASSDATATYEIGPLPRYALFEIPGNALQINDLGTVIYADKTWKAGIVAPLPGGPAGESASARGINDLDVIIGTEGRDPARPMMPELLFGKICFWPSPSQAYQYIQVVEAGKTVFAYRHHDGFGNQGPASIFSSSGHFIAHGNDFNDELDLEIGDLFDYAPTLWQVPAGGVGANRKAAPASARYVGSPSLMWGRAFPSANLQGTVFAPSALPSLPFAPFNVISQPSPNGGLTLFATPPADSTQTTGVPTTKAYLDGKWQESPTFAMAIDISADGTAIGRNHNGLKAPILLNGQWTDIKRYAPGAPSEWADINTRLLDTTPGGWVLANRSDGNAASVSGVLLPMRVEGVPPVSVSPEASCVDAYSIGCPAPGSAVNDRIWIMAPAGEGSSEIILKSPLGEGTPLKLSAPGIKFGGQDSITLVAGTNSLVITAINPATSGQDVPLKIEMGPEASLSKPIGVKIMKARTVKVTIHPVVSIGGGRAPNPPNLVSTKPAVENYLNKVYGPQVNAKFIVTIKPFQDLDWDNATSLDFPGYDPTHLVDPGNKRLDFIGDRARKEEITIDSSLRDGDANINIYILGGGSLNPMIEWNGVLSRPGAWGAYGFARPGSNMIFIDGDIGWFDTLANRDSAAEQIQVIAHEIGHCIVGVGHPDEGGGQAPLKGLMPMSAVAERLMVSGDKTRRPNFGCRLVKGEWDMAEAWLHTNIDSPLP
ncbi:hypothetical protein HQ447_18755 [bacterium]|nr:hypothetical protein [bacterium]